MHVWVRWLVVLALGALLGGCGRPQQGGEFAGVPQPEVLARSGLHYYAHFKVKLDDGEDILSMHRLDEHLYLLTDHHRLIACDARSLAMRWSYQIDPRDNPVFRPIHADKVMMSDKPTSIIDMVGQKLPVLKPFNAVMFNSLTHVIVLDRATGRQVRRAELPYAAASGGAFEGGYYFAPDTKGLTFAVSLAEEVQSWTFPADDMISAPVQVYNHSVYSVSRRGNVRVARVGRTRQDAWSAKLEGDFTRPFHVDERGCFVAANNGRLYALDAVTGRPLWDPVYFRRHLYDSPQVGQATVFQCVRGDGLYALNLVNGQQRWKQTGGLFVLATMGGKAFLLDKDHTLYIKDEIQGTALSSTPMQGLDLFLPNTTAPTMYVATRCGRLFSIRPSDAAAIKIEEVYPNAPQLIQPEAPTSKPAAKPAPKAAPKKPAADAGGLDVS